MEAFPSSSRLCLQPGALLLPLPPGDDVRPHRVFSSSGRYNPLIQLVTSTASVGHFPLSRCNALSKTASIQGFHLGILPVSLIQSPQRRDTPSEEAVKEEQKEEAELLKKKATRIKAMLATMGDGEISISAYDTAWVALIRDIHGNGGPLFPSSLQWIIDHQLSDGSWGDEEVFTTHDRLINTLACIIALKFWGICPEKSAQGMVFLRENMQRIGQEDVKPMPVGFEVTFPSLIRIARTLDLDLPFDSHGLQQVYAMRNIKLERIPKDLLHTTPTSLLHSLEGIDDLDWEKLFHLRCTNGSFLFSPSSTAFAMMQTRDVACLQYLEKVTAMFNGGVPNVYPIDLFEHLWVVDRLERLGIARYFQPEIKACLDYVYRYWTKGGICWARNSNVYDIDDTAMGFRLLRLHGYHVSPDVFQNFQKDGEFFCFIGQSDQAVTGMYNLNRASQVVFPKESILEDAKIFSQKFLRQKQAQKQLIDKWIITKNLAGEVEYALDFPWHMSLPRVEARIYLEQYGGDDDVWIGKTLYRMPLVNNDTYLDFARVDFNTCQLQHQKEWDNLQRWYSKCRLVEYGVSNRQLLESYFLAACSVFEPERLAERLGWAQTAILVQAVGSYLSADTCMNKMWREFIMEFRVDNADQGNWTARKETGKGLVKILSCSIDSISLDAATAAACREDCCDGAAAKHRRIRQHLRQAWEDWMVTSRREYDDGGALLMARTLELCAGRWTLEDAMSSFPWGDDDHNRSTTAGAGASSNTTTANTERQMYRQLAAVTSSICRCLRRYGQNRTDEDEMLDGNSKRSTVTMNFKDTESLQSEMRELVQCVLQNPSGSNWSTKQTFLTIAKTFNYATNCPPTTMDAHIDKVLFQRVP